MERAKLVTLLNESLIRKDDNTGDELVSAFAQVAERHPGRELDVEPVGVELVEAALRVSLGLRPGGSASQQEIARTIARTLLDDEAARARLEGLWRRLEDGRGGQ